MSSVDVVGGLGVALGFLFGIVGHEYAHARVASALGDKSPKLMGRLTLSPKAHVDPLGTIILPAIFVASATFGAAFPLMFGWGKRHALNPRALRNPGRDIIVVALAGPAVTLLLAVAGGLLARTGSGAAAELGFWFAFVNVYLTLIELLPMPGRDGGRLLARFLKPSGAMKVEELVQYEVVFLIVILLFLQPVVVGMARPIQCAVIGAPFC